MRYFLLAALIAMSAAETSFKEGDSIRIVVNKISPLANPTASYRYYDLPFCKPDHPVEEHQSIGEKLSGNRKMSSLYQAKFTHNLRKEPICEKELTDREVEEFRKAIRQKYVFEMFIESFPVEAQIGVVKDKKVYLANNLNFQVLYNKNNGKIISASVNYDINRDLIDITEPKQIYKIPFTYSMTWTETDLTEPVTTKGFDSFFIDEVHWFSFLNAFVLTSFMIIIVWLILQKVINSESGVLIDLESDRKEEDNNWKAIRADVFRHPQNSNALCAFLGSGTQLVLTVLVLFILGVMGVYYEQKGSIITTGIMLYAFSALLGGFISARFHKFFCEAYWARNLIVTASIFPAALFVVSLILNNIAWAFNSTAALPISAILFVVLMWAFVALPLTILGGITARIKTEETIDDVGVKFPKTPRSIPKLPFYHRPLFTVLIAGLLPFSSINVELYYVLLAMWGQKMYTMYGMVFMMFIMMLNMTATIACISITLTYFQLNAMDYRWWWRSFLNGGSSGIFVFLYSIYFFVSKTEMFGFQQFIYFFGYSALISFAIFLMMGSVGFLSSAAFVRHIYTRSKKD